MKFFAALLVVIVGATAATDGTQRRTQNAGISHEPDEGYAEFLELMKSGPCFNVDPNDPAQDEEYQACKAWIAVQMQDNERRRRRMQGIPDTLGASSNALNNDFDDTNSTVKHQDGTAADFLEPCYPLPSDPAAEGWVRLGDDANGFPDDGSLGVGLDFTFNLYGRPYTSAFIQSNGVLTFGQDFAFFIPFDFPNPNMDMVAPFWADADPRIPEGRGEIWYKKFGDHMAVVWNEMGYSSGANPTFKTNTFQAVISDGGDSLGNSNVCFCYVDMDWWVGGFARDHPATVGINSQDPANNLFVQVGRFFGEGDDFDGPGGNRDGIDWLDYQGSNITRGVNQTDPIQGMCFDARAPENIPPVVSGFPSQDTYNVPCRGRLDLTVTFATPEMGQEIVVVLPDVSGIPGLMISQSGAGESVSVDLLWDPDFASQSGTYILEFSASDRIIGRTTSVLSTIYKNLTIAVAQCGDSDDVPDKCTPIIGSTCSAGDPQPYCTPHRSPEHCPMDESFPSYIRARTEIVQNTPSLVEGLDYWFHYLQDKAAAYAFTTSSGYNAPALLCCADPATWMTDCFPAGGANPSSFVVRAVGDQHSNAAVYVLPSGFGGPELTRPLASMSMAQVDANIQGLASPATKVLVEQYIAGSSTGPSALPNEYKIHAFNGTVGSMNMVLNRGSDCACYAEVDQDWNRLDMNGCFVPNMPFGADDDGDACYDIDFNQGANRAYPMKGHELCGKLDLISPSCLLGELVRTAEEISLLLGVYVRIDFFVGGDNKLYVQEYTFNHNNGLRHCSSKMNDDTGCIDSCFLGRMWKNSGTTIDEVTMGGPATPLPSVLSGWTTSTTAAQCATATAQYPTTTAACMAP